MILALVTVSQLFSALDFWVQLWVFYVVTPSVCLVLPLNPWKLFASTVSFTKDFHGFPVCCVEGQPAFFPL